MEKVGGRVQKVTMCVFEKHILEVCVRNIRAQSNPCLRLRGGCVCVWCVCACKNVCHRCHLKNISPCLLILKLHKTEVELIKSTENSIECVNWNRSAG